MKLIHALTALIAVAFLAFATPAVAQEYGKLTPTTTTVELLESTNIGTSDVIYGTSVTLGRSDTGAEHKAIHFFPKIGTLGTATNVIFTPVASPDKLAAPSAYHKLRNYSLTMTAAETGHIRVPVSESGGHVITLSAIATGSMSTSPTATITYKSEQ